MMKKIMMIGISALLLLFTFVGCNGNSNSTNPSENEEPKTEELEEIPAPKGETISVQQDGQQVTLSLNFQTDSPAKISFMLPSGISLVSTDQLDSDYEINFDNPELLLVKDGETIGGLTLVELVADKPDLEKVDPSQNQLPMQVFAGIALSNHIQYSEYTVHNFSDTSAAATALYSWQDLSLLGTEYDAAAAIPWNEQNCVLFYDYEKLPCFMQMNFDKEVVSQGECAEIAKNIEIK